MGKFINANISFNNFLHSDSLGLEIQNLTYIHKSRCKDLEALLLHVEYECTIHFIKAYIHLKKNAE